jgi:predicted transglutaminase-like cysteine proteinase
VATHKIQTLFFFLFCAAFALLKTTASKADSISASDVFMQVFEVVPEPSGFKLRYCATDPTICSPRLLAKNLVIEPGTLDAIKQINHAVNAEYKKLGVDAYALSEMIAIEKARRLQQSLDVAPSNLLLTIVENEKREERVVLSVVTAWGEFVLDDQNSNWLHWKQIKVVFKSRQSWTLPTKWWSLQKPTHLLQSPETPPSPLTAKPNEWVGYKLTEQIDSPLKEKILSTTYQMYHPYSQKNTRNDFRKVETKKFKKITSEATLNSDIEAFQIETCRRQKIKKCPVTKQWGSSTTFIESGTRVHTCRHSFNNWLALATEWNPELKLRQIYPPVIMLNHKREVVFNSAFSKARLSISIINEEPVINKIYAENKLFGDRDAYSDVSDYIQFESSRPLAPAYDYPPASYYEPGETFYLSGYPGKTNLYGGIETGDAPGNQLVTNIGRYKWKNLFFTHITNTGAFGNSGGSVLRQDGNLVGIFCSGEFQNSSAHAIKTEEEFLRIWQKYLYFMD